MFDSQKYLLQSLGFSHTFCLNMMLCCTSFSDKATVFSRLTLASLIPCTSIRLLARRPLRSALVTRLVW